MFPRLRFGLLLRGVLGKIAATLFHETAFNGDIDVEFMNNPERCRNERATRFTRDLTQAEQDRLRKYLPWNETLLRRTAVQVRQMMATAFRGCFSQLLAVKRKCHT